MKFGPVMVEDALGGIVAHAVKRDGIILKKGDTVRREHISALRAARVDEIVVARLEPGDLGEDDAARRLADRIAGDNLRVDRAFTGRANMFSEAAGILCIDEAVVASLNGIDEAVTLATLPAFRTVVPNEMVATVKIIPFAVHGSIIEHALAIAGSGAVSIAPFRPLSVGVVSTLLPGLKSSVVDKTIRVLEDRLKPAHARVVADERIAHDGTRLTAMLRRVQPSCDIVVVFGASAITDRRDVIPASVEAAGGRIHHFGMPVDPGNLLLLAELGGKPVIGAPGCARSPKENGFDWVLHRMLAGVPVTAADIRRMGTGGLLMEIVSRPQPREGQAAAEPAAEPRPTGLHPRAADVESSLVHHD